MNKHYTTCIIHRISVTRHPNKLTTPFDERLVAALVSWVFRYHPRPRPMEYPPPRSLPGVRHTDGTAGVTRARGLAA